MNILSDFISIINSLIQIICRIYDSKKDTKNRRHVKNFSIHTESTFYDVRVLSIHDTNLSRNNQSTSTDPRVLSDHGTRIYTHDKNISIHGATFFPAYITFI